MNDGKNISKYRGYENEKSMIRASVDLSNDIIISGSENGCCYVWHIINEEGNNNNIAGFINDRINVGQRAFNVLRNLV